MNSFRALMISKTGEGQSVDWKEIDENDLMDGNVTVRVTHSTLNYKDGLALTGQAPVVRQWPMIPGIDFAGLVEKSTSPDFNVGDKVFLNGWGVGETHYGGYAQYARVKSDWLLPLPVQLDPFWAMAIGTAGYTAMLAVLALEEKGLTPHSGPILVTGASGGVGSIALLILAKLGYHVIACTGRTEQADYLMSLGAVEVLDRQEFSEPGNPLGAERFAGAIDVAGSHMLANILSQIAYDGAVASCGLVQGLDLRTSVAPFILRGISLIGIESVMAPQQKRRLAYDRLARDLDTIKLEELTDTRAIEEVVALAPEIIAGNIRGRMVFVT